MHLSSNDPDARHGCDHFMAPEPGNSSQNVVPNATPPLAQR